MSSRETYKRAYNYVRSITDYGKKGTKLTEKDAANIILTFANVTGMKPDMLVSLLADRAANMEFEDEEEEETTAKIDGEMYEEEEIEEEEELDEEDEDEDEDRPDIEQFDEEKYLIDVLRAHKFTEAQYRFLSDVAPEFQEALRRYNESSISKAISNELEDRILEFEEELEELKEGSIKQAERIEQFKSELRGKGEIGKPSKKKKPTKKK